MSIDKMPGFGESGPRFVDKEVRHIRPGDTVKDMDGTAYMVGQVLAPVDGETYTFLDTDGNVRNSYDDKYKDIPVQEKQQREAA